MGEETHAKHLTPPPSLSGAEAAPAGGDGGTAAAGAAGADADASTNANTNTNTNTNAGQARATGAATTTDTNVGAGTDAGAGAAAGQTQDGARRRRRRALLLLLLLLLVGGGAGARLLLPRTGSWYDPGMTAGFYEGKPESEVVADLDRMVAENEMSVSCAPVIRVDASTGEAEVRVESIAANHVDQRFVIALDDGTTLYESGAVSPGSHVQRVTLDRVPEAGERPCIVTFQGYDPLTHEARGGAASLRVTLAVA